MNHVNSGSVPATTSRVHATTDRVHVTIGRVPGTISQVPTTIGRMRKEIVVEYHRSRALHNIHPHTHFLTLKFRRGVSHVLQ
jgi:hypothetical protein